MMHSRRGFELVAEEMAAAGLGTVFGLMGDANLDLLCCAIERHGVRYFASRHESGAIAMADGYSRVTGKVGVASVTCGPGFTNALTALTTAVRNGSRLLLVTGQIPLDHVSRNQRLDQRALAAPIGCEVVQVERAEELPGCVGRALDLMRATGRPVMLNVLTPVLDGQAPAADTPEVDTVTASPDRGPASISASELDADAMSRFAARLMQASRPVILVGRGAVAAGALPALSELADRTNALLATTLCAKGACEGNPRNMGLSGGFSPEETAAALRKADVVAAFGASLNAWTCAAGRAYGDAAVLQCDIDPLAAGRATIRPAVQLVADARIAAEELLKRLATAEAPAPVASEPWWSERQRRAEFPVRGPDQRIDPRPLCVRLDELLPTNRSVTVDGGHFFEFPSRFMKVPDERAFVYTLSFGSIGLAMPMGLGAAIGRPDRRSIVFVGDGGFMMSLPELETAVRYRLPVIFVVLNDEAYGAEIKHLEDRGWSTEVARFETPDLAAVARSLGAVGISIRTIGDLDRHRDSIVQAGGPVVVEAPIDIGVDAEWISLLRRIRGG